MMMRRTQEESADSHRTMQVVNHVRTMIVSGALKPGDQIPPERDFARQLNISRATLRAGIGYLAALGVMKIKHGVGTFVADGPPDLGRDSLSFIGALHGFQSWQMFETRILLETEVAALAAERGMEEHHTALAEEVAEMFSTVDKPGDYLVHDVLFHRLVAQAAGNPILGAIVEAVTSSMYDKRRRTVEHANDLRESAEMHRRIYRALRSRKPQEARSLMEQHLRMAQTAQGMEKPGAKPLNSIRRGVA